GRQGSLAGAAVGTASPALRSATTGWLAMRGTTVAGTAVASGRDACGPLVGNTTTEGGWRTTVRMATGICPSVVGAAAVVAADTGVGGDQVGCCRGKYRRNA